MFYFIMHTNTFHLLLCVLHSPLSTWPGERERENLWTKFRSWYKWKIRNVLFYDTLKHISFTVMCVGHVVKDHLDSERKPAASITWAILLHGLLFFISSKGLFYMHHPSCGTIAGRKLARLPWGIDPTTHHTISRHSIIKLHLTLSIAMKCV